jgi:gas vesicle protein
MSEKQATFGKIAIGLLIGALVGSAAALLTTPQSGQQTREQIQARATMMLDNASTTVQNTRSRADVVLADVQTRSQEFAGRLRRGNCTQISAEIIAE